MERIIIGYSSATYFKHMPIEIDRVDLTKDLHVNRHSLGLESIMAPSVHNGGDSIYVVNYFCVLVFEFLQYGVL